MLRNSPWLLVTLVLAGCTVFAARRPALDSQLPQNGATALAFSAVPKLAGSIDIKGRKLLSQAELKALNFGSSGESVPWESAKSSGSVFASQPFKVGQSMCRTFEHRLNEPARPKLVRGTACQRNGDQWQLVQ